MLSIDGVLHDSIDFPCALFLNVTFGWQYLIAVKCSLHENLFDWLFSMALKISRYISAVTYGLLACGTRNGSSILYRTEKTTFQLAKRNASIHTSNALVRKLKAEHIQPLGWALLVRKLNLYKLDGNISLFSINRLCLLQRLVLEYGKSNVRSGS